MKKTLLLGGAGFIGLQIAKALSDRDDHHVVICDNLFRSTGEKDKALVELELQSNVSVIEVDLTSHDAYKALPGDIDEVYMLASIVGVDYANNVPHEIVRINTAIILHSLEWLKSVKPKRVLFTSTSECYAGTIEEFEYDIPTPESVPLCISDIKHPRFSYAVTKMLGECGVMNYAQSGYFESVVVRYHNVYGPRMGFKHVIPHVVQRFLDKETPFKLYGHDQTRSFNYIDDAVAGTIAAMEKGGNREIYHIGAGEEITIEQLVKHIGHSFEFEPEYEKHDPFPGSVSRRCPDISKAMNELGYKPEVSWKEGVATTVQWYLDYISAGGKQYESYKNVKGSLK